MIVFTAADLAAVENQAEAAAPFESCGLLEGTAQAGRYEVLRVHPSGNVAPDRAGGFEVDPRLLLRLQKELRGGPTDMIGIYHSHPRGAAAPSATDLAMAWQPELVWIITALTPKPRTAGFLLVAGGFEQLDLSVTAPAP